MNHQQPEHTPCNLVIAVSERLKAVEATQEQIREDLGVIREKLLSRPPWAVALAITILSTTCASLFVFSLGLMKERAAQPQQHQTTTAKP